MPRICVRLSVTLRGMNAESEDNRSGQNGEVFRIFGKIWPSQQALGVEILELHLELKLEFGRLADLSLMWPSTSRGKLA